MDYDAVLAQVLDLLQREQRLSYRVLKRRLHLDDDVLEDLKEGNRSPYENRNHAAACDCISQAGRRDGTASPCRAASWAAVR
jgi:hypothetical protein